MNKQDEVEVKARELLATEWDRSGFHVYAKYLRSSKEDCNDSAPLRALVAALRQRPVVDDAIRKNAARYEWLRDQESFCGGHVSVNWNIGHDWIPVHGDELDAAIDSALLASYQQDNGGK